MYKIGLVLAGLMIISGYEALAQDKNEDNNPTIVYGAAATPDGGQDVFVVEQPKDAPNPLGDPITGPDTPPEVFDVGTPSAGKIGTVPSSGEPQQGSQLNQQWQNAPAVPTPLQNGNPPEEAEALGKDFQNTLMEANGMVYDVQAYPEQDLGVIGNPSNPETIYSPNVNN